MKVFLAGNEGRIGFLPLLMNAYKWMVLWSSFWHEVSIINLLLETVRVALWSEIGSCIVTLRKKGPQGPYSENRELISQGSGLRLPLSALADRAPSLPDAVCWQIVFATRCVISVFYLWIHLIKIHSCRCKNIYHLRRLWQGHREGFYSCNFSALYFGLFSAHLIFPGYS